MRFVAIASLRRGAIEPAEALNDRNQALAIARYEGDENGVGEIVVWQAGWPMVAAAGASPHAERRPRVSAELRMQLSGPRIALDDEWQQRRRRAEAR